MTKQGDPRPLPRCHVRRDPQAPGYWVTLWLPDRAWEQTAGGGWLCLEDWALALRCVLARLRPPVRQR